MELAEEELADLLRVPLDVVVLSPAVNVVGDDVVVAELAAARAAAVG